MAIRIRVYPQGYNRFSGMGLGVNRFGGAVTAQRFYSTQLQNQQKLSNLQLGYERQLWNERLEKVRLEERLKNPYAQVNPYAQQVNPYANPYGGYGVNPFAWGGSPVSSSVLGGSMLGSNGFFGGLGLGGLF